MSLVVSTAADLGLAQRELSSRELTITLLVAPRPTAAHARMHASRIIVIKKRKRHAARARLTGRRARRTDRPSSRKFSPLSEGVLATIDNYHFVYRLRPPAATLSLHLRSLPPHVLQKPRTSVFYFRACVEKNRMFTIVSFPFFFLSTPASPSFSRISSSPLHGSSGAL